MRRADQIRFWQRLGLCSLLCVAMLAFAAAQTETSAPEKQPAHSSTASTKTDTSQTKTHANTKHASSHSSSHSSSHTSSHTTAHRGRSYHGKKVAKKRGQQAIDSDRARQIQTALIREHYMQGEPSGTWDAATQAAMQRYQADHGWQSKTTPDSRALIQLGLGPSNAHLLNPESAMTTAPTADPKSTAVDPKAGAKPPPAENNIPQR
ncbi:MAG: peptidoglycan-binding domain-containing protein [Terriglobales bacterium]